MREVKPARCDICNVNVPSPWTIVGDMFNSVFHHVPRKYPEGYDSILISWDGMKVKEVGVTCVAHFETVKERVFGNEGRNLDGNN